MHFWRKVDRMFGFSCLREMVRTTVLRQDPPFCKKTVGLFMYPPFPTLKDGVLFVQPPLYQEQKLRKRFKPPCAISPAMQASCTPNMKVSTQILRPINFVHLANQTGGILHSPPTPTQGGSSSSTLGMTTFLMDTIKDSYVD